MSTYARQFASKVRGMNIAEHAFFRRICEYHNARFPNPFPKRSTLAFEFECSRIYVTQVFQHLEQMRFLKRKRRPDDLHDGPQESNEYEINFDRWFPYADEETERANMRMLAYFRHSVATPELAQGFLAAWIEPRKSRSKAPREKLWIAIESQSILKHLQVHIDEIKKEIFEDTGLKFEIRILDTYIKKDDVL